MITCYFENKSKAFLRHVTVDALVVRNNKILLVKRASNLTNPNKYALPGGFLDRNEKTKEAVLRELLEETGYKGETITLFRVNDNPERAGEDRQNIDFVFLVKALKKLSKPDQEIKEIYWFDLDKLPKKDHFAFDHYENIKLYLKYRKKPIRLPIIG